MRHLKFTTKFIITIISVSVFSIISIFTFSLLEIRDMKRFPEITLEMGAHASNISREALI